MSLKSSRTQQKTAIKAQSSFPLTFEALGQDSGLILYESIITNFLPDPAKVNISSVAGPPLPRTEGAPIIVKAMECFPMRFSAAKK